MQQKVYRQSPEDRGQKTENRKGTASRVFCLFSVLCPLAIGKGEKVGGRKPLNVRAHQRRGDSPARQTPPGARPNRGQARPAPLRPSGRLLERPGNRPPRKMTVADPQGSGQNPAYRPARGTPDLTRPLALAGQGRGQWPCSLPLHSAGRAGFGIDRAGLRHGWSRTAKSRSTAAQIELRAHFLPSVKRRSFDCPSTGLLQ